MHCAKLWQFFKYTIAAFSRRRSPVLEEQMAQIWIRLPTREIPGSTAAQSVVCSARAAVGADQQRARSVQELQETKIRPVLLQTRSGYLDPQVEKLPQMT